MTEFKLRNNRIKKVIEIFRWAEKHTEDKYIVALKKESEYMTTVEKGDVTFSEAVRYIDEKSVAHFRIRYSSKALIFDIAEVYVEGVEHILGIYLIPELFDEFERKYEIYR